jgi:hypothetical protein
VDKTAQEEMLLDVEDEDTVILQGIRDANTNETA